MYRAGRWDLSELVKDHTKPEFEGQVRRVQAASKRFEKNARPRPDISAVRFSGLLSSLEEISHETNVIGSYASLAHAADTQSDELTSLLMRMNKVGATISNSMVFFDLWWKKDIDEKNAKRLIRSSGELVRYLEHKRLLARYSLSEGEEKIINTLDVTGTTALTKLYDKITGAFSYKVGRKKSLTREELSSMVRSPKSETRKAAYRALLTKYSQNIGVLGEIYQNIVQNWRDEGIEIRGHKSPISIRNIANDIDDKTIDALLRSCKKNTGVFQRFFVQKAKMLGVKKLRRYDIYAVSGTKSSKKYTYNEAATMVLDSLQRFSPKASRMAKNLFDQNHIDSELRRGKRDGAFCSSPSPKITPYVLLSFTGEIRDVFTLAHELGHAIHSQAASERSILVHDASLPLAETASTFSELLLYDNISAGTTDVQRRAMLSEKIGDLYASIGRQSFFTLFEQKAHDAIADGSTIEEVSGDYLENLEEQFGRAVDLSPDFASEWSCIPHFYHYPFYCYAYAFGNLLSLSLFQRYKKEGADFVPGYLEILAAGGSQKPETLLESHGFDITKTAFWQGGFDYIESLVKDLESSS